MFPLKSPGSLSVFLRFATVCTERVTPARWAWAFVFRLRSLAPGCAPYLEPCWRSGFFQLWAHDLGTVFRGRGIFFLTKRWGGSK